MDILQHKITVFESLSKTKTPFYRDVTTVLERIRIGRSEDLVVKIREATDKDERNLLKKKLPAICFSGTFSERNDSAIIEHSGLICLDFDGYKTKTALKKARKELCEDDFVFSVFTSPSGNGLKVLVRVPPVIEDHRAHFNALEAYFSCDEFDTSTKNESRVCYESFDPKIHINLESEVFTETLESSDRTPEEIANVNISAISDHQEIIDRVMVWWKKELGFVAGRKNTNLFSLASALCNYGIPESVCLDHVNYIRRFDDSNAPQSEITNLVKSAYKRSAFDVKTFEDQNKVDDYVARLRAGEPTSKIKKELVDSGVVIDAANAIVSELEDQSQESVNVFWKRSERGIVSLKHHLFKEFLVQNGFYKFYPEGSENFIFVRKLSNKVSNVMDQTIKDFVLTYVETRIKNTAVWDFFAENTKYFRENFLSMLPDIKIDFIKDTPETSYLFYRNAAVKVTKDGLELIEYENLDGWIWEDQTIDRDFTIMEEEDVFEYEQFIRNVSDNDDRKTKAIESTIGFLLHTYKDPEYCPAVIVNDEIISEDPEGGTGKGIFMSAISKVRKKVSIDGKRFSFDKSFPYQTVQQDTQVLVFDDVKSNFDFESLFSVITEGIELEKKNKDAILIPFADSPKIGITTNYGIKGRGGSHDRRKWEIEFAQYYNMDRTPVDEHGRRFFDGWEDEDWLRFDTYMVSCLQMYLSKGFVRVNFSNVAVRRLISDTCFEFYDWMEQSDLIYNKSNIQHLAKTVYNEFVEDYPDFGPRGKFNIAQTKFYRWMRSYGKYKYGMPPNEIRITEGKTFTFLEKSPQKKLPI